VVTGAHRSLPFVLMHRLLLVAALVAFPIVAAACSSEPATCESPTSTTTVDMQNSTFAPGCVSTTAGQTLSLHNADDTPHTFTVKDTDIDVKIEGGQTATASLDGIAPGTYAVTCLYHPQMTESLQVT
jgi:plastocyanin